LSNQKVFVIGAGGMVGATIAHSLAIKEVVQDIVLVDVAEELVKGQAEDISHATAYTDGVKVSVGSYSDIKEDDIIVITCGVAQKPGQSRLELLETNSRIIKDVTNKVMLQGKPVYILMVSNPVDVLTFIALKTSGLSKERVFGTGTTLDTSRLRVTLSKSLNISQNKVNAYVLGEHGDSSFSALSNASIDGVPLNRYPGFEIGSIESIDSDIRDAAYRIINAKKSTYYGIGNVVSKIIEAMTDKQGGIFPVCSLVDDEYGLQDVVIGLPSEVSRYGVKIIDDYPLNEIERIKLRKSATIIRDALGSLK
jgi:L-lactate dehydrogenase